MADDRSFFEADWAKPEAVGLSSARLHRLDAGMRRYVDRGQVAGAVTVVERRGKIVHLGCYGQADLAAARPMRLDAIFRIFSMTKPVTSLAVLMLYEEGHFQLNYPISFFFPAFNNLKVLVRPSSTGAELAPLERPITIHDLLTHTSGLGYGLDASTPVEALYAQAKMLRMDESMSSKIDRLTQLPLHHQPGKRYTYSMATDVLGHLVELISGMALDEFFTRRIFEPLGMTDTDFYVPTDKLDRLAALYTPAPDGSLVDMAAQDDSSATHFMTGAWVRKDQKPAFLSGGGGLVSTAADYLRFARMLRGMGKLDGERLVSRKTIELMTAPHLSEDRFFMPGLSCGLGVTVMTDPARAQMLGSPGAYSAGGAANTDFWVDPREEMLGVLMVQVAAFTPSPIGLDFKTLAAQAIDD